MLSLAKYASYMFKTEPLGLDCLVILLYVLQTNIQSLQLTRLRLKARALYGLKPLGQDTFCSLCSEQGMPKHIG